MRGSGIKNVTERRKFNLQVYSKQRSVYSKQIDLYDDSVFAISNGHRGDLDHLARVQFDPVHARQSCQTQRAVTGSDRMLANSWNATLFLYQRPTLVSVADL